MWYFPHHELRLPSLQYFRSNMSNTSSWFVTRKYSRATLNVLMLPFLIKLQHFKVLLLLSWLLFGVLFMKERNASFLVQKIDQVLTIEDSIQLFLCDVRIHRSLYRDGCRHPMISILPSPHLPGSGSDGPLFLRQVAPVFFFQLRCIL